MPIRSRKPDRDNAGRVLKSGRKKSVDMNGKRGLSWERDERAEQRKGEERGN